MNTISFKKGKCIDDEVKISYLLNIFKSNYRPLIFCYVSGLLLALFVVFATKPQFETSANLRLEINDSALDEITRQIYRRRAVKLVLKAMTNNSLNYSSAQICHQYSNKYLSNNMRVLPTVDKSGVALRLRSHSIDENQQCIESIVTYLMYDSSLANLRDEVSKNAIAMQQKKISSYNASELVRLELIGATPKLVSRNNAALLIGSGFGGMILGYIFLLIHPLNFRSRNVGIKIN